MHKAIENTGRARRWAVAGVALVAVGGLVASLTGGDDAPRAEVGGSNIGSLIGEVANAVAWTRSYPGGPVFPFALDTIDPPPSPAPPGAPNPPSREGVGAGQLVVGPQPFTPPAGAIIVPAGANLQQAFDSAPEGATIVLSAGVYRDQYGLRPRRNQRIIGMPGAVLNGSRLLSGFTASGGDWVVGGQSRTVPGTSGQCEANSGFTMCMYPEDVFIDDVPQRRVGSRSAVGPGDWFYDYAAGQVWIGTNPAGRTVEISRQGHAIVADVGRRNDGVEIRNLIIEKYGVPGQEAAIQAQDSAGGWWTVTDPNAGSTGGWLIVNNEIRLNHAGGVFAGNGTRVEGNFIHHNGQIGVKAAGRGASFTGNEISYNNQARFDTYWEAGGGKFWNAIDVRFVNNFTHHNIGAGIWADYALGPVLIDRNTVADNTGAGINMEMTPNVTVTNNLVTGNDHSDRGNPGYIKGGIFLYDTPNTEVAGNVLEGNYGGVIILVQERGCIGPNVVQGAGVCPAGSVPGSDGPYRIHDNLISMTEGHTGVQVIATRDYDGYGTMPAQWIRDHLDVATFTNNTYQGTGYDCGSGSDGQYTDHQNCRFFLGFAHGWMTDPNNAYTWSTRRYIPLSVWRQQGQN